MFGFMLVSTHHKIVENTIASTEKHFMQATEQRENVIRQLRQDVNAAQDETGSVRAKLEASEDALAACRKHADDLTAQITRDEPLVAAGRAAKQRETAKKNVASSSVKKPASKKAVAA
jgi:predicted  nucleic acid-binding Zn-ribbon protein